MVHLIQGMLLALAFYTPHQVNASKPPALKSAVRDIVFGPADIAWVLMRNGEIAKTTDAGATWRTISSAGLGKPDRIAFIDSKSGWSADSDGNVRRTLDGGQTWATISNILADGSVEEIGPIVRMEFIDSSHGWVLDPFALWRTNDSGLTWTRESVEGWFVFFHFVDSRTAWLGNGAGDNYKTVDGGRTWGKQQGFRERIAIRGISFASSRKGWLCAGPEGIFQTSDGGESWKKQTTPGREVTVTSIQFLTNNEGWATGVDFNPESPVKFWFRSFLLHTVDGGEKWVIASTINGDEWYHRVHFSDGQRGWLYTDTQMYRTEDGGRSWNMVLEYPRPDRKID